MASLQAIPFTIRYPDEIQNLPMFLEITKYEAETIVRNFSQGEGTYIFRPSSNGDDTYFSITLSVSSQLTVRHLRVNIKKDAMTNAGKPMYYITKSREFASLMDFLLYYHQFPICCEQNVNVRLLRGLGFVPSGRDGGRNSRSCSSLFKIKSLEKQHSSSTGNLQNHSWDSRYLTPSDGDRRSMESKHNVRFGKNGRLRSTPDILPSLEQRQPRPVPRSASVCQGASSFTSQDCRYTNSGAICKKKMEDPKFRPRLPIPGHAREDDYVATYFEVDPNKNFFQETYAFLKETELCECGLRVVDSSLPLGWAVHKFSDEPTGTSKIFFQQGEKHTSWNMPAEIVPLLSSTQVKFICELCQDCGSQIPACLLSLDGVPADGCHGKDSRTSAKFYLSSPSASQDNCTLVSSSTQNSEGLDDSNGDRYETPASLLVPQFDRAATATSSATEPPSSPVIPSLPEDPAPAEKSSEESAGVEPKQEKSSGSSNQHVRAAEVQSACGALRRDSFNSIPVVNVQTRSGPPSSTARSMDSSRHS
ncbi:hypothetical protein PoB_004969300 [Plakobranchus ocellatus]|uniref:SH2 domain-containing protein n=1 Tax=Plakobranchus ocellatus TaxID=259542 RepID=A0AAV4BWJ0_9GAST|nr:hypothetical protein PoB_004969300 [Plakobranchus ocellatus]